LYTHCESSTVISLSVPYPALTKPFTKEDACVGKKKEEKKERKEKKRENEIQQKLGICCCVYSCTKLMTAEKKRKPKV